jgi:hypothetical protein
MTIPASIYYEIPYGVRLYGELGYTPAPSYLIEPFIAQSLDYGSIGVSWHKPTATASRWRLLANRYGYPVDQNDGNILIDVTSYPGNFYFDTDVIPGSYHYYGMYALVNPTTDQWVRAGVTACLANKSFNSGQWLLDNLPAYFTEYLNGELTQDASGNPYLQQYLNVVGWGIDYLRTQMAMGADHLNDPMAIPIGDLMNLATELGIEFDPMISVYLMRKAAANWAHVMQERGTPQGIENELELSTGFGVDLQIGPNLMLEVDQAQHFHPQYAAYDPSIAYALGERVSYGDYWYACAIAGTKNITPTGTNTSNANWTVILDSDEPTGVLTNPTTGGVNTWEVIYPGVSNGAPLANSIKQGIGVPNPLNSAQWNFNDIRVYNKGGSAQDIWARSVSRTTTDMLTTTTTYAPDPLQAIHDGVPVPWVLSTQAWNAETRYATNDIVYYNGLPFMARRASTGATPPVSLVATPEWYPLSPNMRLPLMVSAYTSQSLTTGTDYSVPVTPFVEWYDEWGNFITRVFARTPTAGTPGIPDGLAFDSFTKSPGPSISGRTFDNAYAYDWVAQDSDFKISGYAGGVAYPSVTGTRAIALTTGPANTQIGVTFVTAATGGQVQSIVFRYSADNDYWKATTPALVKKVSGTFTTVATYSAAAQPGDRLVVQANGSSITVLLNGVSVATATDSFNDTATSHGIGVE